MTVCGKTSKRIKQAAKGEDVKTDSSSKSPKPSNKRSFVTYNGTGNASVKGKREDSDGGDAKRLAISFCLLQYDVCDR